MALRSRLPVLVSDAFASADDRALLERFAESRDEAAFATVVARHARMVYGVCRRAVRDEHLAEDAFQAVFLVLANHPARAMSAGAVAGWLFGVARRVGLAARRREERFARRQMKPASAQRTRPDQPDFDDLLRVLDEELAALPEEYRTPLVACFLEERTLDGAARHLGWSVSTLRRRLDRAKELLSARLTRRGATLSAGLFAGFLAPSARAAVPARLIDAALSGSAPAPLAAALAAECGPGSLVVKGTLAAVVLAAGLGGLALAINPRADERNDPPSIPTTGPEVAVAPAPHSVEAKGRSIRGRVVFPQGRAIPTTRLVPPALIKDAGFFGAQTYRDLVIDPQSRGIANAVVWLRPDSTNERDEFRPQSDWSPGRYPVTLTHEGFSPRVIAIRSGDQLVFSNPTPVSFTVRYEAGGANPRAVESRRFNVLLPPGGTHSTGPIPALTTCDTLADNIHPWVRGFVWAFEHPYFAVTDAGGNFTIEHAPPVPWRLVVWHEKAGFGTNGHLGERVLVGPNGQMKPIVLDSAKSSSPDP